jgi:hypothetical protein
VKEEEGGRLRMIKGCSSKRDEKAIWDRNIKRIEDWKKEIALNVILRVMH